jgi:beta-RFAP synthase
MVSRFVEIVAPSRVHFGLLSFGGRTARQYGGAGVMVEPPVLRLRITPAERFVALGSLREDVRELALRWTASRGDAELPACQIEIAAAPRHHAGLGVGTQLGLSVAAGLNAALAVPPASPQELARSVGRGLRSAGGTYGFALGGLIAERGKLSGETLAPLDRRLAVPAQWRFVLVSPRCGEGLHGQAEREAFGTLPAVEADAAGDLRRELHENLLPAAEAADFAAFSDSVYRFGYRAGLCFAALQGGPYNGPRMQELVELIRDCGVRGVGQSSWGPTIYAVCPDEDAALRLVDQLTTRGGLADADVWVSAPCNCGAQITVEPLAA